MTVSLILHGRLLRTGVPFWDAVHLNNVLYYEFGLSARLVAEEKGPPYAEATPETQ